MKTGRPRQMKSMRKLLLASGALLYALAGRSVAEMPRFEAYRIGDLGQRMGQTSLVDVDCDGDLDWVVGQAGKMWWFEYVAADRWIQHASRPAASQSNWSCVRPPPGSNNSRRSRRGSRQPGASWSRCDARWQTACQPGALATSSGCEHANPRRATGSTPPTGPDIPNGRSQPI